MVKETEINEEIFLAPISKLIGIKSVDFTTDDGPVKGIQLFWVYPEGAVPGVLGRGCSIQFIRDGNASDWVINGEYEPNVVFTISKGKPDTKIDGYRLRNK